MHEKVRTVYYCDYCKLKRMQRNAMVKHERFCTLNPHRQCRWLDYNGQHLPVNYQQLIAAIQYRYHEDEGKERPFGQKRGLMMRDIDWLREKTECPACMLAVLRQSGVEYHYMADHQRWDYLEEVERFRSEERKFADYEEMRAIESSWI